MAKTSKKTEAAVESNTSLVSKELRAKIDALPTTSAKIRFLRFDEQMERGKIAKILSEVLGKNVRYQHVRNVEITPIKKAK